MPVYDTPGVYYQRADATAPAIAALRTDVAGFVGISQRGLIDTAMPIESWRQFEAHYGGFTGSGFLAYAVRAFFENGGRRCWVVRVASNDPLMGAAPAATTLRSATQDLWLLRASSPGVWGNDLSFEWRETHQAQTTLLPHWTDPNVTLVNSITGFARGSLVRLRQPGAVQVLRVVSAVDAVMNSLIWKNPRPDLRLSYELPLEGLSSDFTTLVESIEYSLVVKELGTPVAVYSGLTLIPEHPGYGPNRLPPLKASQNLTALGLTLPPTPEPVVLEELRSSIVLDSLLESFGNLTGGADGLSLLDPDDFRGADADPVDSNEEKVLKTRGFRALDAVQEVTTVAVPDIHIRPIAIPPLSPLVCIPNPCLPGPSAPAPSPLPSLGDLPPVFSDDQIFSVQLDLVNHCELLADRIALLDPPYSASKNDSLGLGAILAWRARFDSSYAALYYPWIRVVDPLRQNSGTTRDIPPCGHVAGQFANTDFQVGVHKAPANVELQWIQDVTASVNESKHGILNTVGVDAIRAIPGRGLRISGARTISSDSDWRFVNVRRLMLMIEKALMLSVQWAVFEPNNELTRSKLRMSIFSFLLALWQRGALMGDSVAAAFQVKCDDTNNTPADRDAGRLIAQILVAPSQPFEFVEIRLGREGNQFEIQETAALQEVN
jgi:phage tail sheath protein FI